MNKSLHLLKTSISLWILLFLNPYFAAAQSGNNCNTVANLTCGQSISSTTVGGGNDFTTANYSCHLTNNSFDAEDKVYKIVPVNTGVHEITLSGLSKDLDLFLFSNSCTSGTCIAKSTLSLNSNDKINVNLNAGSSYYLVVDGYNASQVGSFQLSMSCPPAPVCAADITTLNCGEVDTFTTVGRPSQYSKPNFTSCMVINNSTFAAGDKVFKYKHVPSSPHAVLTIWDYSKDLDLFVFNSCNTSANCIKSGKNKQDKSEYIDFTGLPYGDYYIVVDGFDALQVSSFLISVNCQQICQQQGISTPITCGQTVAGNTSNGSNVFAKYSCDPSYEFTGPEKYYSFKAPSTDTFRIDLFGFNNDLELFITEPFNCDLNPGCKKSSLHSSGLPESVRIALQKDETIYIVIDGSLGDRGPFQLKVTCPPVSDRCDDADLITCGIKYSSSTLHSGNQFTKADYSDCYNSSSLFNGNDKVFKYTHTSANKNARAVIWGFEKDLDLFLLNSCNTNTTSVRCSASSVNNYESVDFTGLPYGDYYIVVDGYNSIQNDSFNISISCQYVCQDSLIQSISCNTTVQSSTTGGMNRFSKYSCFSETVFTGPEKYYRFKAIQTGEHIIDLTGFNNDLELFVVDSIDCVYNPVCRAKSITGPGHDEQIKINLQQNETINILVDGALGVNGPFTLKVSCPVVKPIRFDVSDSICDIKGKTVQIPVKIKNFKNVTSFSMTIQSEDSSIVKIKSISSNTLNGLTYFVQEVNKTITISYLGANPTTLSDGTTAFLIEAVLSGNTGQSALIKIVNSPTMIKAVVTENNQNSLYPVETINGSICILAPPPTSKLTFNVDDNICDSKGKNIQIPVRVSGFTNIRAFSMTVTVDSTSILQINNISSSLSGLTFFEATPKKTFTLQMLSNTGITLADGTIVFNINASLVGNVGQTAHISIVSIPTNIQAIAFENNQNINVPVDVLGGTACINAASLVNLSGKIIDRQNAGIKSADVKLRGTDSLNISTPDNGTYTFNNLVTTGNYTLSVMKNTNTSNGIDLLDLTLLQDHIITRTVITDPYKLLAADINRDGSIDILDLAELQDLIITRISNFTNNTSWIFIPTNDSLTAAKVFNKTYLTTRTVNSPAGDQANLDFYGIKIGDINQSANPQTLINKEEKINATIQQRSIGSLALTLPSMTVKKDQTIYVPLILDKFTDVRVFQLLISWDHSKMEYLKSESFNTQLNGFDESNLVHNVQNPGLLNSLWLNTDNSSLSENTTLFVMVFKVKANPGETFNIGFKEIKAMEVTGSINSIKFTDSKITVSDISTAFKEVSKEDIHIKVYPNPTAYTINLIAESPFEVRELIDARGVVYPMLLKAKSNYSIDLNSYAAGVYFIKTKTDQKIQVHKFILNK
ncbi:MAG: T9SS type A sorting domain-containing protein [Saprospiraceae bacterium]